MSTVIKPEIRRQLAATHGIHEQYLYQCLTGRKNMNPAEAMRLETESGGVLRRQDLCQGTWLGIWPELAEPKRKPAKVEG